MTLEDVYLRLVEAQKIGWITWWSVNSLSPGKYTCSVGYPHDSLRRVKDPQFYYSFDDLEPAKGLRMAASLAIWHSW